MPGLRAGALIWTPMCSCSRLITARPSSGRGLANQLGQAQVDALAVGLASVLPVGGAETRFLLVRLLAVGAGAQVSGATNHRPHVMIMPRAHHGSRMATAQNRPAHPRHHHWTGLAGARIGRRLKIPLSRLGAALGEPAPYLSIQMRPGAGYDTASWWNILLAIR